VFNRNKTIPEEKQEIIEHFIAAIWIKHQSSGKEKRNKERRK
jgi:hypothetical protein